MTDSLVTPPNNSPPVEGETPQANADFADMEKQELLMKIKARYEDGVGAFEENRRLHTEDLNFVYNAESQGQWDPSVLEARRGKPCYTFNRVIGPVNITVADMRQTKPSGRFRPASNGATEVVADILGGIMRAVEDESRADAVYKNQYKFAVAGGFGAWRLLPVWAGDDTFDQVLRILDIPNPQTVIWDPEVNDPCAGDAMWCIVGDRISKEKHKSLHPNAEDPAGISFNISRDSFGWFTDKEVRVAEYFERVPFEKTIALMSDGSTKDYDAEAEAVEKHLEASGIGKDRAARVVKTRRVLKWRVMWVKCNGGEILEGPIYYDWKRIPVVRVPGRYINIEGRKKLQSLIRHSKDAQRSYNSRCSDMIERSALIPKAPYLVTETMIKGYENEWSQSSTASRPYLPYNVDPKAIESGGMPFRTAPIDMPQGALALAQQAAADIQATTGFFDPALGNSEDMNRVSGKALVQHTRRSDLGSFEFIDGYGDALQLTWEMGGDMIPTIYDTERIIRIVGQDEVEKEVTVNSSAEGAGDLVNDLKKGSYNCKVAIGPSYQTARQETLATLIDAAETIPAVAQIAGDLIAKNIDSPDADEMARRLRIPLIKQGIVEPTAQEKTMIAQMPSSQPSPEDQLKIRRDTALAIRDEANARIAQSKAGAGDLEIDRIIMDAANKHLTNLTLAKQLGEPSAAANSEAQAASTLQPNQPAAPGAPVLPGQ